MLEELLPSGSIGIDKTRIRVPLHPNSFTPGAYMSKRCAYPLSLPDLPDVRVGIDPHDFSLAINFNPSRFVWAQGLQLCPFSMLALIAELVIQKTLEVIDPGARLMCQFDPETGELKPDFPTDWVNSVMVSTLNLSADFVITNPKFDMKHLVGIVPKWSRTPLLYLDRQGNIETITHKGNKKGSRHSFYNKSQERKINPNPEAPLIADRTFRYEVQVPRWQLSKGGMGTLDRCTEAALLERLKKEWDNSRLGADLVWEGEMISLIQESGLTPSRADQVIGFILASESGVLNPNYSHTEIEAIYRDLALVRYDRKVSVLKQGPAYGRLSLDYLDVANPMKPNYRISRPRKLAV